MLSVAGYSAFCKMTKNKCSFLTHALTLGVEFGDIVCALSAS